MLKLKNVSKFYYSNGIVTSGFTKLNLELKKGEFVAITGESGSGKSTLLNVISGLDSYEEGEMYINGEETSAYSNADFENYRRKYIANIYQSFNLINSYSVYQNVDMVLRLSKTKIGERRKKVIDVLKKVGLYKYRHTKASRLSGGQKQRVAIARALVKDTPIIVADEPTGNLDSESAANVIKLLSELAADKLVIVVTHNYDQVEPYVTRKITMHDGRLTEDLVIKPTELEVEEGSEEVRDARYEDPDIKARQRKHLGLFSRIRLGFRNAFNIIPKFLLILFIFAFICAAVVMLYANMRESDHYMDLNGYNWYFNNNDERRIVIKKADKSPITADDFEAIRALKNVGSIFEEDVLLDNYVELNSDKEDFYYYLDGNVMPYEEIISSEAELSYGRLPENSNEVLLIYPNDSYLNNKEVVDDLLSANYDFMLYGTSLSSDKVKVVGIKFVKPDSSYKRYIGVTKELLDEVKFGINGYYGNMSFKVAGQEFNCEKWSMYNKIVPSKRVQKGTALVPSDWNYFYEYQWAPGNKMEITVKSMYYTQKKTITIGDVYYQWNFTQKTGYTDYEWNGGVILIHPDDYNSLFPTDSFQSSVFVEDASKANETAEELKKMGYVTLVMKDALYKPSASWMVVDKIFNTFWSSSLVIILFFIAYFIIKLILKSRNVYFATLRMLGASAGDCRSLICIELLLVLNIAFLIVAAGIYAASLGYIISPITDTILEYLTLKDYGILYIVLNTMSLLIAITYSSQLFKSTAMNVYKEV